MIEVGNSTWAVAFLPSHSIFVLFLITAISQQEWGGRISDKFYEKTPGPTGRTSEMYRYSIMHRAFPRAIRTFESAIRVIP
jgi:hypothetical protein